MSYAVVNPPPTAVPLPVIASANENTPYWAPAGSGGGGGSTSSISGGLASVNCDPATNNIDLTTSGGAITLATNESNIRLTTDRNIIFATNNTLFTLDAGGDVNLATSQSFNVSSIVCSTINGVAPGGGVSADLTVSTITAANFINAVNQNNLLQSLRIEGSDVSSFHMITVPGVQTGVKIDQATAQVVIQNADLVVSSINGTTFASANTRFGSAVIPTGGSTVRQLSPPYASPDFYTQLTYAGPQMGPASTLSAVATNLSSVTIYGEEGMLVNYMTIG